MARCRLTKIWKKLLCVFEQVIFSSEILLRCHDCGTGVSFGFAHFHRSSPRPDRLGCLPGTLVVRYISDGVMLNNWLLQMVAHTRLNFEDGFQILNQQNIITSSLRDPDRVWRIKRHCNALWFSKRNPAHDYEILWMTLKESEKLFWKPLKNSERRWRGL